MGGEHGIETVDSSYQAPAVPVAVQTLQDVEVQVDARLVGEVDGRYITVACRVTTSGDPNEGFTGYSLVVQPVASVFYLDRWQDDEPTALDSGERADAIHPGNEVNSIELSCVGNRITARVNGVEGASVRDAALTEGLVTIGAGVFEDWLPATVEARFDNLVVDRS